MKLTLRRRLLWLALPASLVALAVGSWTPREPSWEGRSLSEWLKDLVRDRQEQEVTLPEPKVEAAARAIQSMGANSLPFLLRRLNYLEPLPLEDAVIRLNQQLGRFAFKIPWDRPEQRNWSRYVCVYPAIEALGHQAAPAVPELQRQLFSANEHRGQMAAQLLARIHPEGTAALIAATTNRSIPYRHVVITPLDRVVSEHPETLAHLLRLADDADPEIRRLVCMHLCNHREESAVVLPVLIRLLADPDDSVRFNVLLFLPFFSGDLRAAEPAVAALFSSTHPGGNPLVTQVLEKIRARSATLPPAAPAPLLD